MAYNIILAALLGVGAFGGAAILGLALAALVRRRSWPYLLVALALGTLLVRVAAGAVYVQGTLGSDTHHLLEHGLDIVMAALVIAAVVFARDASPPTGGEAR